MADEYRQERKITPEDIAAAQEFDAPPSVSDTPESGNSPKPKFQAAPPGDFPVLGKVPARFKDQVNKMKGIAADPAEGAQATQARVTGSNRLEELVFKLGHLDQAYDEITLPSRGVFYDGGCSLQVNQPKLLEVVVKAAPFRRAEGPLAAPFEMLLQTVSNVRVDLPEGLSRIAKIEVVRPAFQMPVQVLHQSRDRLITLPMVSHLMQFVPFPLQRLLRRRHIQVLPSASFQIVVIAERVSQKVQTRPFLVQFHHSRFLPVDLQLQPVSSFASIKPLSRGL